MTGAVRLHASAEDLSKDYLTPCKCNIDMLNVLSHYYSEERIPRRSV
jgi:hypothetical protein